MVEAFVLWNEPNNLSHWNFHLDPGWERFAAMVRLATAAVRAVRPELPIVLGGVSSCDVDWLRLMKGYGVTDLVDAVAVHGFPLDWNHWAIDEWPARVAEARAVTGKPVWVTEVGASSFGAEEVQRFGFERTAELLRGRADRLHWYSLYDLPPSWPAETRHKEAEGSSYYRHYYMGLMKHDGAEKLVTRSFPTDGSMGLCQWFHFDDHRLEPAARWMRERNVRYLRTGMSWADAERPGGVDWLDRQQGALQDFQTSLTLCFTPERLGVEAHHTSPPKRLEDFAEFAAWAAERYVSASVTHSAVPEHAAEPAGAGMR